jgi:hypothetical protein
VKKIAEGKEGKAEEVVADGDSDSDSGASLSEASSSDSSSSEEETFVHLSPINSEDEEIELVAVTGYDAIEHPFCIVQSQGELADDFEGHYLGRAKGTDPYLASYSLAWTDAQGVELQLNSHRPGHTALVDTFSRSDILCRNIQLVKKKLPAEVVSFIKAALARE